MYTLLLVILLLDCLVLAGVVLLQAGQGGGLASLGGGGGTESFVGGRQAVTFLTRATRWSGGLFLGISFVLSIMSSRGGQPRSVLENQIPAPTPIQSTPLPFEQSPVPEGEAPTEQPPSGATPEPPSQ